MISRFKYQGDKAMAWPLINLLVEKLRNVTMADPGSMYFCPARFIPAATVAVVSTRPR